MSKSCLRVKSEESSEFGEPRPIRDVHKNKDSRTRDTYAPTACFLYFVPSFRVKSNTLRTLGRRKSERERERERERELCDNFDKNTFPFPKWLWRTTFTKTHFRFRSGYR